MSAGLRKNKMLDIADTNMANFGTQLEKDVKAAAADGEPAWDVVGKPGMWIWRIEKFKVVPWPEAEYGNFYTGDSYIVLWSRHKDGDDGTLLHSAHFWLGRYTSQDEYGTAAYKTVELDDKLGGAATQYREVQGHESAEFVTALAHCPGGAKTMFLMEGGIESGFRHVTPEEFIPRLLWVRKPSGQKVQCSEVPCCIEALDRGDVYLLDTGLVIYQWNGASASPFEKSGASTEAAGLVERPGPDAKHVVVEDDGDGDLVKDADMLKFIKPADEQQQEDLKTRQAHAGALSEVAKRPKSIHKLSDAGGDLSFSKVSDSLERGALGSDDAFVVDAGAQVFVWLGKGASGAERRQALHYAEKYTKDAGFPFMPIAKVSEGAEPPSFTALVK